MACHATRWARWARSWALHRERCEGACRVTCGWVEGGRRLVSRVCARVPSSMLTVRESSMKRLEG
eukprot:scaffold99189_cov33-Phaeocystis_antarctica.AAC.1